jgi:hypothetical protein
MPILDSDVNIENPPDWESAILGCDIGNPLQQRCGVIL